MADEQKTWFEDMADDHTKAKSAANILSSLSVGVQSVGDAWGGDASFDTAAGLLSGLGTGLMTAAATTGPIGIAAGAIAVGVNWWASSKKREARREQLEKLNKKWKIGLEQYKKRLKDAKDETALSKKNIEQAQQEIFSLAKEAEKDELMFAKLESKQAPGITNISARRQVKASQASARQTILEREDNFLQRLDLLDEINKTIDKEEQADRELLGEYRTKHGKTLDEQLRELSRLENE